MKPKSLLILTVLVVMFNMSDAFAEEGDYAPALISSMTGNVIVGEAGSTKLSLGKVGLLLNDGDSVKPAKASAATILFKDGGRIQNVGENQEFVIKVGEQQGTREGLLSDMASGLAEMFATPKRKKEVLAASAAVRKETDEFTPLLQMPINAGIADVTPVIHWRPVEDVLAYEVTIREDKGSFLKETLDSSSLALASYGKALKRDKTYTVSLDVVREGKPRMHDEGTLWLLETKDLAALEESEESFKSPQMQSLDETTRTILYGGWLEKHGFLARAYDLYGDYASKHPDTEFAKDALARIEILVGIRRP